MKIFLLAMALFASSTLQAQRFSAGARSGMGFWKGEAHNKETFENAPWRTKLWEKEIFVRYESARQLAFEMGLNQVSAETDGVVFGLCGTGLPDHFSFTTDRRIRDTYYGLNLRLQYGISCPRARRLTNYPGIAITPTLHIMENRENVRTISPAQVTDNTVLTTNRDVWMQIGVEDIIRYRVSKHLDVHTLLGYKYIVGGNVLQRAFTVQAGMAYCF